jgi:nicotinamide riboside transporter PnuC
VEVLTYYLKELQKEKAKKKKGVVVRLPSTKERRGMIVQPPLS